MATLTCDICGGKLVIGAGGAGMCGGCGTEHNKDRMREKILEINAAANGGIKGASEGSPAGSARTAANSVSRVIPKRFTDKFINDEIIKLMKSIADCESRARSLHDAVTDCEDEMEQCRINIQSEERNISALQDKFGHLGPLPASVTLNIHRGSLREWTDRRYEYKKDIDEIEKKISEYEIKKHELEVLLRKTEEQRADEYYQRLLNTKNGNPDIDKLAELTGQFNEMEGYKDTKLLAKECFDLGMKKTYDGLVEMKAMMDSGINATPENYKLLADKFREAKGYADTAELASECDKAVEKAYFNSLVKAKTKASTEKEFQDLAKQFRALYGYENAAEFASECDNQARALKERREEQERVERERSEERKRREALEAAAKERKERELLEEAAKKHEEFKLAYEREEREHLKLRERKRAFIGVSFGIAGGLIANYTAVVSDDSGPFIPMALWAPFLAIWLVVMKACGVVNRYEDGAVYGGGGCGGCLVFFIIVGIGSVISTNVYFVGIVVGIGVCAVTWYLIGKGG